MELWRRYTVNFDIVAQTRTMAPFTVKKNKVINLQISGMLGKMATSNVKYTNL